MKQKPAILQVIPDLDAGGAELSTLEIVDALHSIGVPALVATEGGRMAPEVERLGGDLFLMPAASKNPYQMIRNKQLLQRWIAERNVMLVHARSRAPAWSSLWAARKTGTPFVTTYHGAYGEAEPFKRLYNSVMARGDMVIANSKFTADLVRTRHQTPEERLRIIYRGVDIEKFSKSAIPNERREGLLAAWGVPKGRKIILLPARLTRWKGQGVVIAAMKTMIEKGRDCGAITIIAGDHQGRHEYVDELKRQISSSGLEERVLLVGHCTDMAAAYSLAHVTIIASIEPEAFGRTSAEAQAMGCPVIATNIGAPSETVRAKPVVPDSEMTGWLVPPDEPEALANALSQALAMDEGKYRQLAQAAVANVATHFSDRLMKSRTLAVYDNLLGTDYASQYKQVNRERSVV